MGSAGTITRGERRVPSLRRGKPVAWLTLMLPVELGDRLAAVVSRTNAVRPIDRRFIGKSTFAIACIEDGVAEAESRLARTIQG